MKIKKIKNIIAQDKWEYVASGGKKIVSKIIVGKPTKGDKDWVCPILIEHFTPQIVSAYGIGPVDALMNAMMVVKAFFDSKKDKFTKSFRFK